MDLKDPQKEAVYDWEAEFADWNRKTLPLAKVRAYIQTACAHYGLRAPAVKHHTGKAYAFYKGADDYGKAVFSFPDWCMNPAVALHEAAHYIVEQYYGREVQDHGPIWLGVYMWLLESAYVAPRNALRTSAKNWKLKWRTLPPSRLPKARSLEIETEPALLRAVVSIPRSLPRPHGPTSKTQRKPRRYIRR